MAQNLKIEKLVLPDHSLLNTVITDGHLKKQTGVCHNVLNLLSIMAFFPSAIETKPLFVTPVHFSKLDLNFKPSTTTTPHLIHKL